MNKIKKISLTEKGYRIVFSVSVFLAILLPLQLWGGTYTLETIPNTRLSDRYNYVSNPDGIITPGDVQQINRLLRSLEDSLGIEVAVVAVESIGDNEARDFATDLFKKWGIGKKADDNGLLIQLVTEPVQRSVVFETGYGIEGVLPDAICYRIQQRYMIPDMREGNFSSGMVKGVAAVREYLLASDYERGAIVGNGYSSGEEISTWALLAFILIAPLGIMIIALIANYMKHRPKKCPRCGKKTFRYIRRQTVQAATYARAGMAEDLYRCSNCEYTEKKNHPIDRLRRGGGGGPIIFGGLGGMGSGRGGNFGGGGSWGGGRSGGGGSISRF